MIVTQVVQWLLPTPKILGSNKVTQGGGILIRSFVTQI